jgi:hypothetical protein
VTPPSDPGVDAGGLDNNNDNDNDDDNNDNDDNNASPDTAERSSLDEYNDMTMGTSAGAAPQATHQDASAPAMAIPSSHPFTSYAGDIMDMSLDPDISPLSQNRSMQPDQRHARSLATDSHGALAFMDLDPSSFLFSPDPTLLTSLDQADIDHHTLLQDLSQFDLPGALPTQFEPLPNLAPAHHHHHHHHHHRLDSFAQWDMLGQPSSASDASTSSHSTAETPVLIRDGRRSFPAFTINEETLSSIKADVARRLGVDQLKGDAEMPTPKMCDDFLACYISNFHGHFPIMHLPTFSPSPQSSPLFLIMCSIGALYRLDRRRARRLYDTARKAMDRPDPPSAEQEPSFVKDYPLWVVQARVLQTFYAIMSGDMDLVSGVMRENGVYTVVYTRARTSLQEHRGEAARLGWHRWAHIESWKRLMGAILILSTLCVVIFHVNPGMNSTLDLDFDALHDEKLWSARSSAEWKELCARSGSAEKLQHPRSMKHVLTDIMLQTGQNQACGVYPVSAYSALVLMHAIVVHMWQRAQVCQALATAASGLPSMQEGLSEMLVRSGLQTLSRCQRFLDGARNEALRSSRSPGSLSCDVDEEKESSLVFNSYAILRIAHTKLITSGHPQNFIDLANLHGPGVKASIASFVNAKPERGAFMLEAVVKAFEGLREPVEMGYLLVRKTAAFRWSVEQAVAGWDCGMYLPWCELCRMFCADRMPRRTALLVSKWVHGIEMELLDGKQPNAEEMKMMDDIKAVLHDAECDVEEGSSIAAALASTWSYFLRDVNYLFHTPSCFDLLTRFRYGYGVSHR